MGAVCNELDHSMLFVHGNVSATSLMWGLVRLWELLGSWIGLAENEGHSGRSTSWVPSTRWGGNWTGINHGRLEHGSLEMIGIGWFRNVSTIGAFVDATCGSPMSEIYPHHDPEVRTCCTS